MIEDKEYQEIRSKVFKEIIDQLEVELKEIEEKTDWPAEEDSETYYTAWAAAISSIEHMR